MKNFFLLISISLVVFSCSEEKEVKFIPLTSESAEAIQSFKEGIYRFEQNELVESREAFKKALEYDKDFLLAMTYFSDENREENRKRILYAYENRDRVSEIERKLIEAEYQSRIYGELNNTIKIIDTIISKNPDIPYLYEVNGFNKTFNNEFDGAIADLNKAMEINPKSYRAALVLGLLHVTVGADFRYLPKDRIDLDEGQKWLEIARKIRPEASATPRYLGNLYRAKLDLDKALEYYSLAIELNKEKTSQFMEQSLMLSHTYTAKGEYELGRKYYNETIDASINNFWVAINSEYYSYTLLYEKKYDEAIKFITESQDRVLNLEGIQENLDWGVNRLEVMKFLILAHSLRQEESMESLSKINAFRDKQSEKQIANAVDQKEIDNILRGNKVGKLFRSAWADIIFGNYSRSRSSLEEIYTIQKDRIEESPNSLNGFYNLSGYLNLMEGNTEESIKMYTNAMKNFDLDEYHNYFYALALKASGDSESSREIFIELANNPFANWQIALVKNLAKAQVKTNI